MNYDTADEDPNLHEIFCHACNHLWTGTEDDVCPKCGGTDTMIAD